MGFISGFRLRASRREYAIHVVEKSILKMTIGERPHQYSQLTTYYKYDNIWLE